MTDDLDNVSSEENKKRIVITDEADMAGFGDMVTAHKIPVLILDQKWHRLFALGGKPDPVKELERQLGELLKRQGELNTLIVDVKKVKSNLMSQVVSNMEGTSTDSDKEAQKRLDDNKRLLDEANTKIEEIEDEIKEIPESINQVNKELMLETMNFCYLKLRTNTKEADEINDWIKDMRIELKKNLIKKQNREINNREIYSYMHDIFGKEVLDIFDVKFEGFDLSEKDTHPTE